MSKPPKPPSYRRRSVRGKDVAYVTFTDSATGRRRDYWLGEYGSVESRERYARLLSDWEANGRTARVSIPKGELPTITQVCHAYWRSIQGRYSSSEAGLIGMAIRVLRQHFGETSARDFGPRRFRQLRDAMVCGDSEGDPPREPWSRKYVNGQVGRIRRIFKWAVSQELLPAAVHQGLGTLESLRPGQTVKADGDPVRPVPEEIIAAVRGLVSRQVAAMIELQLLTGMRSGEVCTLRPVDLDMSGKVWAYRPERHKTAYRGRKRTIWFGPRAQQVVRPFLAGRAIDAPLFSPREAEAERRAAATEARVTPCGQGNGPGTNRVENPRRQAKTAYTPNTYRRAIVRACELAGIPAWHPHQLRHNYATDVRKRYGLEAAQILLGHSSATLTDAVYAERDEAKAARIAQQIG